ncbi:3-oxoadipate enol-lactonase [Paraburkholderia fungorum]|uniref:3-oxoadipate enol-lactonase n=1 Tax=Acinetobacter lwoffii K24 TaxID=54394 RepID=Q934R9_ACILW|nr:3-oxoadipate enol-lactonase [Paraburkholderia fungorum]AAL02147.1 CatD [Acinetobacter lwoffii K24]KFX63307.1 3-oxoadipate enol-lactonase [Burkholderia sp. K24]MBB5542428.1 3-oxoadipate enol-lactonase [Paraburkholderia fungorum]PNE57687.1 3-oxoadipate enol-lactonase [Paraburkholderia fungorum]
MYEGERLQLPNHHLHYRLDGDATDSAKPWLLFCNSLGTDLHMWDAQAAGLSPYFRVLRYDRRGHGKSDAPSPPYSLTDLGRDVIALLDALKIERAHFCGLSIGGLTGQWLGINAGTRFDRLVLCATAAKIGTEESWNARIDAVKTNGLAAMTEATAERWFTSQFRSAHKEAVGAILETFAGIDPEGYNGCCAALAAADLREEIRRIAHPVLAISGSDDSVCPPGDLQYIADNVQRGKHLALPGRHIVNVESAQEFNAALLGFLIE